MKFLGIKKSDMKDTFPKDAWEMWEIDFCQCGNHAHKTLLRVDTKENVLKILEKQ